ncbi:MAG: hypothetical protein KF900_12630 [Bacteroidetes bacterium]|nr:hypothetical protein [Bacteroidota bacterium]
MKNRNNSLYSSFDEEHGKGNTPRTQIQTIFHYLQENIATASMVSEATGVPHKNICRYKRDLEKHNLLWEVERKPCKKTKHKAWYITTNPNNVLKSKINLQTKLTF